NAWANRRCFAALEPLPADAYFRDLKSSHGGLHGTLCHIVWAEQLWLNRWLAQPNPAVSQGRDLPTLAAARTRWEAIETERAAPAPRNKLNGRNLPGLDGPLEPKLLTDRSVTNYATGSSAVSHAVTPSKRQSKPRWKRRKDARPGEIVAAALEVFGERGFAATKLADVARRAGVTKGTVYLYFDSKEALFKAVVRETIVPVIAKGEAFAQSFTDRK